MSKNQLSATAHIPNVQEGKRHGRSGFDIAREVSLTLNFFFPTSNLLNPLMCELT